MNRSKPRSDAPGMSLIEIMVAMTIFGIVLMGVVPMMMNLIAFNRESRKLVEAREVLTNFVELTVKTRPASSFTDLVTTTSQFGSSNNPYTITEEVAEDTINTSFRRVIFTIQWGQGSKARTMTRETRVFVGP